MKRSIAYEKAYAFSIRVVNVYKYLERKNEYILSRQLLKCGTSIAANLAEANGAISQADFSAKVSIAYKETLEAKYWTSLLKDTGYINRKSYTSLFHDLEEIAKILFMILKKTRIDSKQ
ncbi:MAG: four helix bundle protein [Bacteroidales bacterium]|nr:four helix bundle protein [Bacteroidales bacterium]